ncbi:MAG: hypothetical protein AB2693_33420 [Candidatus Thiodiazotropha sp.]
MVKQIFRSRRVKNDSSLYVYDVNVHIKKVSVSLKIKQKPIKCCYFAFIQVLSIKLYVRMKRYTQKKEFFYGWEVWIEPVPQDCCTESLNKLQMLKSSFFLHLPPMKFTVSSESEMEMFISEIATFMFIAPSIIEPLHEKNNVACVHCDNRSAWASAQFDRNLPCVLIG